MAAIDQNRMVLGKSMDEWETEYPLLKDITALKEAVWINPDRVPCAQAVQEAELTLKDVTEAERRWQRFAAYFTAAFPETRASAGIIESPLKEIPAMKALLEDEYRVSIPGRVFTKLDSDLPISGSIKARGGIYEVLKTAEDIALREGYLQEGDSYACFNSEKFYRLFSRYSIGVGSTGNLGLSIGIMSAKLGFQVTVHMSHDARQWKKDMLRSRGVTVREYESDYSVAVKNGRELARKDPLCHFVDDENSRTLFLGYSVAALRLKKQLQELQIAVDRDHPLMVYLPCGVGGGPGGVAFGIKLVFGDAAHCFFAEPTHACCMLLGMLTNRNNEISVQDFGIDNRTIADGLAVGRPSGFVGAFMRPFMSGCYSLGDERMSRLLAEVRDSENIRLEPSALSSFYGPVLSAESPVLREYLEREGIAGKLRDGLQLCWATGGGMVPREEMAHYYEAGKKADLSLH